MRSPAASCLRGPIARLLAAAVAVCAASSAVRAIDRPLTALEINRALALARWPHSDAERARFHGQYVFAVNTPPIESWAVDQVEIVTPFRRVELMAEAHQQANDLWGRGGTQDVEQAIRPWRDRVSIIVRVRLLPTLRYVTGVPPIDVALAGPGPVAPIGLRRTPLYANWGLDAPGARAITGGLIDAIFDAAAIGQTTQPVVAVWNGRTLARVGVNFGALE